MYNKNIFFSGELPPDSLNGIAYSNAILVKYLKQNNTIIIDKEVVDLKFHHKFSLVKTLNLLYRLINVIKNSYKLFFNYFYIVFSNSLVGAIKTLLIIYSFKLFNKKAIVIVHIHRGDLDKQIKKSNIFKFIFKLILVTSNKLIVLSDKLKYNILYEFQFKGEVICLENTVFNETKLPKKNQNSSTLNCIYISNYIEEKGILVLLNTFKNLDNNYKLACYGSFTDETLKETIFSYKSENITINGPIYDHDKFIALSNSDLLILPSYNEGKPLILLESMMLGTPFIATKVGYIDEMVESSYPFLLDNVSIDNLEKLVRKYFSLPIVQKNYLINSLINRYNLKYSNNIYLKKINEIFND